MAVPKHYELFIDVLDALDKNGVLSNAQLYDAVAEIRALSAEERAVLLKNTSVTVFNNRVGWAKTYLKAASLVEYPKRGYSQITDEGRKVLLENPQPLNVAYLRNNYESARKFLGIRNKDETPEISEDEQQDQTPQERMDEAFTQINNVLKSEILNEVMSLSPAFFERLVVKLLEKMGYGGLLDGEGVVTSRSNDEGIDGIIREDKLGFSNIYIQAKRYGLDKTVSRPDVQGFVGAIANKSGKGLFITTAKFTSGAIQCAKDNHIVLVDGDKLAELMIDYGVGVSTIQTYEIKRLDSDFFIEQE